MAHGPALEVPRQPEALSALEPILVAQRFLAAPMTFYTLWWTAVVDTFYPHIPRLPHPHHFHQDHDQLVIPEPIEETGEHALFA